MPDDDKKDENIVWKRGNNGTELRLADEGDPEDFDGFEKELQAGLQAEKLAICALLEKLGIVQVEISYSGSGDDGSFDEERFLDAKGEDVGAPELPDEDGFGDRVIDFMDNCLNIQHSGWGDGDGGAGTITLQVPTRKVFIDHNDYYTESNNTKTVY